MFPVPALVLVLDPCARARSARTPFRPAEALPAQIAGAGVPCSMSNRSLFTPTLCKGGLPAKSGVYPRRCRRWWPWRHWQRRRRRLQHGDLILFVAKSRHVSRDRVCIRPIFPLGVCFFFRWLSFCVVASFIFPVGRVCRIFRCRGGEGEKLCSVFGFTLSYMLLFIYLPLFFFCGRGCTYYQRRGGRGRGVFFSGE